MELKVGKRYLIARNTINNYFKIDTSYENKETHTDAEPVKLISEVIVDEISVSGEYVKFITYTGFPINEEQWERANLIDILEKLPDKKFENEATLQYNVYEKLTEFLEKMLTLQYDKCKNKRKKCKK